MYLQQQRSKSIVIPPAEKSIVEEYNKQTQRRFTSGIDQRYSKVIRKVKN